ncbi:MAG: efflux RND transporter periplasmic adaptor subunit [Planctomycetes bacterium]|nr:efflux RND transporter periplasmic adaptor subunit [Planctomycetota bacterium]
MKASIIVAMLLVTGAGSAWWFGLDGTSSESASIVPDDGLFTVRRGPLNITITENGTLVAKESAKVAPTLRGDSKIVFLAEEGSQVEEGEVVVELDADPTKEQLESRELEVVKAQADLDTAKTELEIQEGDNVAAIEKAKVALEKANMEHERYLEGDAPKQRRELQIAIEEARINFTKREKVYNDSLKLREKDYVTQSQLEEDRIAYEQSKVKLQGAERDLELFDQYTFPMGKVDKDVAVSDAERGLDTAEKRAQSQLRQKQVAVEQFEQRLQKLSKQVEDLEKDIEGMTLRAPSPGIVIYGDPRRSWWRQDIRVGAEIWGNQTILTIPDLRVMQVNLQVHEADVSKLVQGLSAKVTMDTYPGLVLDGEVTKIAALSSDNDQEVKKFDVEVTLATTGGIELRPGISAKAEIFIESKDDVLYVPLQCAFLEEGQHWAYVLEGNTIVKRAIQPGSTNESYLEVLDGLVEGDRVLLYNPQLPGQEHSDIRTEGGSEQAVDGASEAGDGATGGDGTTSGAASGDATTVDAPSTAAGTPAEGGEGAATADALAVPKAEAPAAPAGDGARPGGRDGKGGRDGGGHRGGGAGRPAGSGGSP